MILKPEDLEATIGIPREDIPALRAEVERRRALANERQRFIDQIRAERDEAIANHLWDQRS